MKEKRQRPSTLQQHLQETTQDRQASDSLANAVGDGCTLALGWGGAGAAAGSGSTVGATTGGRGVVGVGSAGELALDNVVGAVLGAEVVAINIGSADEVEGSPDVLQGGHVGTRGTG